ncbi:MAG: peptide chain release factor 3 [Pseudomonadota bacterium]|nr:peptide chain release factor 3 [Pseudomonadota bacterium]
MTHLTDEIERRRTFAIIAHPDAGKTTLTEKLLLFGGAIQMAGAVKARGDQRRARSDWMKVEQDRGISVSASVMTFDYQGHTFNLLDTPGHEDFSEDTYRVLTAVDSAVMVLDAARGIQSQTRKLFEVCRLRDVPIVTFVNKMDREARDPFELMDEIEQDLQLDVTPANWPVGMGRAFQGCYDLFGDRLVLMGRSRERQGDVMAEMKGLEDPGLEAHLGAGPAAELREAAGMARELCPTFDPEAYRQGNMTPVFFGSAINAFGVQDLLSALGQYAPRPRPQAADRRAVAPEEEKVTGFVFKIQANMDPKHRDRVAFVRLASGHFRRGMRLKHVRTGKQLAVHNPVMFLAGDRETAEEAFPGDIIGIPNHGQLSIGDTLTEGEELRFRGVPSFAPELLQRVRATDPMRAKHLGEALKQLAEEGVARVFRPRIGSDWVVGVLGALQFDVLAERIKAEYNLPVRFEQTELFTARWVFADSNDKLKRFADENGASVADDHEGDLVFLARNAWHLERAQTDFPDIRFMATKDPGVDDRIAA